MSKYLHNKIYNNNKKTFTIPENIEAKHIKYFEDDKYYSPHKRNSMIDAKVEINLLENWFINAKWITKKVFVDMNDSNSVNTFIEVFNNKKSVRIRVIIYFSIVGNKRRSTVCKNFVFCKDGIDINWDMDVGSKKMECFLEFALLNLSKLNSIPITLSDF